CVAVVFFFFQAEDGIRDGHVTGVQTCALPIYGLGSKSCSPPCWRQHPGGRLVGRWVASMISSPIRRLESSARTQCGSIQTSLTWSPPSKSAVFGIFILAPQSREVYTMPISH